MDHYPQSIFVSPNMETIASDLGDFPLSGGSKSLADMSSKSKKSSKKKKLKKGKSEKKLKKSSSKRRHYLDESSKTDKSGVSHLLTDSSVLSLQDSPALSSRHYFDESSRTDIAAASPLLQDSSASGQRSISGATTKSEKTSKSAATAKTGKTTKSGATTKSGKTTKSSKSKKSKKEKIKKRKKSKERKREIDRSGSDQLLQNAMVCEDTLPQRQLSDLYLMADQNYNSFEVPLGSTTAPSIAPNQESPPPRNRRDMLRDSSNGRSSYKSFASTVDGSLDPISVFTYIDGGTDDEDWNDGQPATQEIPVLEMNTAKLAEPSTDYMNTSKHQIKMDDIYRHLRPEQTQPNSQSQNQTGGARRQHSDSIGNSTTGSRQSSSRASDGAVKTNISTDSHGTGRTTLSYVARPAVQHQPVRQKKQATPSRSSMRLNHPVALSSTGYLSQEDSNRSQLQELYDVERKMPTNTSDAPSFTSFSASKNMFAYEPKVRRFVVACLFVGCAAIGGLVYLFVWEQQSPATDTSRPPTSSPTFFEDDIFTLAVEWSGTTALETPGTPQRQAVGWLSTFDQLKVSDDELKQRYALACFAFGLDYETWDNTESWLDPTKHECDWSSGISCFKLTVTAIDKTRNNLNGTIVPEISLLASLEKLVLPKNPMVTGTLPSEIGELARLEIVDLSSNGLTGSIPPELARPTNLVYLDMSGNDLNNSIPTEISQLRYLRTLDLGFNTFSGTIHPSLNQLKGLVTLNLQNNQLSGTFPFDLQGFPYLDNLLLDSNIFSGLLPPMSPRMLRMKTLTISNNAFEGELLVETTDDFTIDELNSATLQTLDISHNQLSGPFHLPLALIPSIRYFDCSGNDFFGSLPEPGETVWATIEHLALADNQFTGTIPREWPDSVIHLDLSDNLFAEPIPDELCTLSNLQYLLLGGNSIGSTIPACMENLDSLRTLGIERSNLIGTIPESLLQLPNLETLDLSDNSLTGIFVVEQDNWPKLMELILFGNEGLSGSVDDRCLATRQDVLLQSLLGCNFDCSCCQDFESHCKSV